MWRLPGLQRCGTTAVELPSALAGERQSRWVAAHDGRPRGGMPPLVVVLPAGALIPMPERGEVVELIEGELWVTREGDRADHVLETPGERYEVNGCGKVVLRALSDVRVKVWVG